METNGIIKEILNHPAVCNVDLSSIQNGKILREVVINRCAACEALTASDCFLIFVNSRGNGQIERELQTRQRSALFELIQMLRDRDYKVELISLTRVKVTYNLTPRQEDIIQFALNKGYFDCPKRTHIWEIAQYFGISISTASEILRRGVKKMVSDYFHTHYVLS